MIFLALSYLLLYRIFHSKSIDNREKIIKIFTIKVFTIYM
nr:MAG TPA: hypothetical protein [Caudoviricetes sp.]